MKLVAVLAAALRALPDEELVEASSGWIASRVASGATVSHRAPSRPPPTRRKSAPVRDAVMRALAASPDALSRAEVALRTKLDPALVGTALVRLGREGAAFAAGATKRRVWGLSQEAADETLAARSK